MGDKIMSIAELKKAIGDVRRDNSMIPDVIIDLINEFEASVRERLDEWLLSQTCLADTIHDCKTDKEKNKRKMLELRHKYREETVGELRMILGRE